MNPTYRIYPNVHTGPGAVIGDSCVLGCPPRGYAAGELPLIIGDRAKIGPHTVIYAGSVIGNDFRAGSAAFIREFCQIGHHVCLADRAIIEMHATVGDHVRIEPFAGISFYAVAGAGCWFGADAGVADTLHPLCPKAKVCIKGGHFEPGVIVGARALTAPDILIGEGAVLAPGSFVLGPVPAKALVAGSPARIVGTDAHPRRPEGLPG